MRKQKKVLSYQISLVPEKSGGYTVVVATLPGCVSYGSTIEEATQNAREAIELHLENLAAHKEPIPFPKTVPKGTLRAIIKQAGLTPEEFLRNL